MKRPVTITAGNSPPETSINPIDRILQIFLSVRLFSRVFLALWVLYIALPINLIAAFFNVVMDIVFPSRREGGLDKSTVESLTNKLLTMTDHGNHQYVTVNNTRYHYVKSGNSHKFMFLLHGFPSNWYSWRHQLDEFRNDFTVIAIDLKGVLGTEFKTGLGDLSPETFCKDIHDIIASVTPSGTKVTLIGHDMGGVVAYEFAKRYPYDLERLVIANSFHCPQFYRNATVRQLLTSTYMPYLALPLLPNTLWSLFGGARFHQALRNLLDAKVAPYFAAAMLRPGALRNGMNWYRMILRQITRGGVVDPIDVQTLIIYGENDNYITPTLAYHNYEDQVIAKGRLTVRSIPQAGHFVNEKKPADFNLVVRQFLGYGATNADRSG